MNFTIFQIYNLKKKRFHGYLFIPLEIWISSQEIWRKVMSQLSEFCRIFENKALES